MEPSLLVQRDLISNSPNYISTRVAGLSHEALMELSKDVGEKGLLTTG